MTYHEVFLRLNEGAHHLLAWVTQSLPSDKHSRSAFNHQIRVAPASVCCFSGVSRSLDSEVFQAMIANPQVFPKPTDFRAACATCSRNTGYPISLFHGTELGAVSAFYGGGDRGKKAHGGMDGAAVERLITSLTDVDTLNPLDNAVTASFLTEAVLTRIEDLVRSLGWERSKKGNWRMSAKKSLASKRGSSEAFTDFALPIQTEVPVG